MHLNIDTEDIITASFSFLKCEQLSSLPRTNITSDLTIVRTETQPLNGIVQGKIIGYSSIITAANANCVFCCNSLTL